MKKIKIIFSLLLLVSIFSSCLETGLDELPSFKDAEITNFRFEYRWFDDSDNKLRVIQLPATVSISEETNIISCELTVPAESGSFTTDVRDQVTLKNIVGYADLSPASKIEPLENSPTLGIPADFSTSPMQYEVIAADGKTKKIWNIDIISFSK